MKDNDQKLLWEAYLKEESGAQPLRLYTPSQSVSHLVYQLMIEYQRTGELRASATGFDTESHNPFLEIIHVEVNDLTQPARVDDPTVPPAGRQNVVIRYYRPEENPTSKTFDIEPDGIVAITGEGVLEGEGKFTIVVDPARLINEWTENIPTLNMRYQQDWLKEHEGETLDIGTGEWEKEPWSHQPRHKDDNTRPSPSYRG